MSDLSKSANVIMQLDAATHRVLGLQIPPRLQSISDNHITRLLALVDNMRLAGVDEKIVRHSVRTLVAAYEAELVDVVTSLTRGEQE